MSPVWVVSSVLAWIVIVLLVVVVLRLLRMLGALQAALEPTTQLYDEVDGFEAPTLLVVHQPGCSGCEHIPAALGALADDPTVEVDVIAVPDPGALPGALRPATLPAAIGICDGLVVALSQARTLADLRAAAAATSEAAAASPATASRGSSGSA